MKHHTTIQALLKVALILGASSLVACGDDSDANDEGNDTGDTETGDSSDTLTTTSASTTASTTATTATTASTTETADTTDTADTSSEGASTTDTSGDEFVFAEDPYSAYTQIDRHGAVEAGTAGIAAPEGLGFNKGSDISIRDDYNASNPVEDAAEMWIPEIAASVMFFHAALDDDLLAIPLVPASFDETIAQAGPVIVPDTIKYDPSQPTAYPNGRTLQDQVVDITLAAVLLQLGPAQPLSTFADLPLNPPENDVPFEDEFPYLAPPHAPLP
ncbi:MAG: DUF4331 family protein [Deltaproteobacteria bacterium]|nr:DUF4331 family protein [Nannocystaceae bacterium]